MLRNVIAFLLGFIKMYLMWCFVLWEIPLDLATMDSPSRGLLMFLSLCWGALSVCVLQLHELNKGGA